MFPSSGSLLSLSLELRLLLPVGLIFLITPSPFSIASLEQPALLQLVALLLFCVFVLTLQHVLQLSARARQLSILPHAFFSHVQLHTPNVLTLGELLPEPLTPPP